MRRVERWPWIWAAICSILVLAVAALSVALYSSHKASGTASCVNSRLGDRAGVTAADAQAHIDFARADSAYDSALVALTKAPAGTSAQQQAIRVFVRAANQKLIADGQYVRTLLADQTYRDMHPLGEC